MSEREIRTGVFINGDGVARFVHRDILNAAGVAVTPATADLFRLCMCVATRAPQDELSRLADRAETSTAAELLLLAVAVVAAAFDAASPSIAEPLP